MRAPVAVLALLIAAVAGCALLTSEAVVSGGDSTPIAEREAPSPYDALEDRTAIVAYEFGRCSTNADCGLVGCGGAMCGSEDTASVCVESPVSLCLAQVDPGACGCVEGVCRWARNAPVLQCARYGDEPPENRGRYRGPGPYGEYPLRNSDGDGP